MKRRFLMPVVTGFIAMFLLVASASFAQDKIRNPEEHAKKVTDKMKTGIPLTENQYSKVYDLNLSYANKMQDLKKKQDVSLEDKKKSLQSMRQQRNIALSAILSQEQMEKYKSIQKEEHKEMRDRRKGSKEKK
ncbi:MAG: hypothetical protein ABI415_11590 [Flavitalea sp.]